MKGEARYFLQERSTLDATPRQKSALCISSFKVIAIAVAITTIALYYIAGFPHELFIFSLWGILIPSLFSLFVPVVFTTGVNWWKIIDLVFHFFCVVVAAVASSFFLSDVTSAAKEEEGEVVNELARASGISGIVLSILHVFIMAIILWKHQNILDSELYPN